jgi:hypothetical protein
VIRLDGDPSVLNRWAALDLPRGLLRRSATDLPNRLKLATAAAVRRETESLKTQLDRMDRDASVAKLIGRLSLILGPALAHHPDGALSVLGQTAYAPTPEAWMIEQRHDLARFCRSAVEADFAWAQGRQGDAAALQAYVDALAETLLAQMSTTETER